MTDLRIPIFVVGALVLLWIVVLVGFVRVVRRRPRRGVAGRVG